MKPSIKAVLASALVMTIGLDAARSADGTTAEKFRLYNLTSTSDLNGVYLAPAGTREWGPNQALNDKDRQVDPTERLAIKGIAHGIYDVRIVTTKGHECVKEAVDLTHETTFDIRDADLACP